MIVLMARYVPLGQRFYCRGKPNENFCTQPQVARTFHGDQWVTAEIEVKGDSISHWVNGEKILSFTNPRIDPEHEVGENVTSG